MPRISVPDVCLVMAAAGAQRTRPARLAFVFRVDMSAAQKRFLFLFLDAGRDMPKRVCVRIDESVARRDVSGGTYSNQAEAGSARVQQATPRGRVSSAPR